MSHALINVPKRHDDSRTRAAEILRGILHADHCRTDRMFAALLLIQWLAAIFVACYFTPFSWIGAERHVHVHVWTAVFVGGVLSLVPVYLVQRCPGESLTRQTIAIAQMLWSALLVHLTGGRIESHFHAFGSLAFLAFYRDWRVILTATVVVMSDHLLRGVYWPMSVFGVPESSFWRAMEHGGWIAFEDFFLLLSLRQRLNELTVIAERQAWQEQVQAWTEGEIASRTRLLLTKQAELQAIHNASPIGMFMSDAQGQCVYVNTMCAEIVGVPAEQCLNLGWARTIHPEDRDATLAAWKLAYDERRRLSREHRLLRDDGCLLWVNATAAPILHDDEVIGFAGTIEDVTHRVLAEHDLRQAKEAAQFANQAKSEFLANMSHELRTPMTAILGFIDILIGNLQQPENQQAAQTIQRNADYLLRLINDILDLSKIEAGKLQAESLTVAPTALFREVLSLMEVPAAAKNLALRLEFSGPLPAVVQTDPLRLRQVLVNLLGNAIKFTEVGQVRLVVGYEHDDAGPSRLRMEVHDTGVGMTAAQIERLFQPFTQADSSTTRKYGGTGLGLTISRRLTQLLGGDIDVRSVPGQGSVFVVTIAAGTSESVELVLPTDDMPVAEPTKTRELASDCSRLRVLLAEDGPDNQRLIAFLLRKAGAQVTVVEHGLAAIDAIAAAREQRQPFDVVLMDMQMPVLDGYTATRRLRDQGYDRPIIALTANAMSGDREKCLECGCHDYTTKPINRQHLLSLVALYGQQQPAGT